MSKSCSGVLEEYIKCVEASGCVSASGRAVKDCARDSAAVPECAKYREARARAAASPRQGLRARTPVPVVARPSRARPVAALQLFVQCKRGQVDMRTRIRGNKGY